MRRGSEEFDADALAFIGGIAEKNDAAFLLFLREGIGEDEHGVHVERLVQVHQAAVRVDHDGFAGFAEAAIVGILSRDHHAHPHEDAGTAPSLVDIVLGHGKSMLRHFDCRRQRDCHRRVPALQRAVQPPDVARRAMCFHVPEGRITRYDLAVIFGSSLHFQGERLMNLTEYIDSKREEHLNDLYEFLRIPSVSAQSEHKPDIERAAKWVADQLRAAGLDNVEIVPTKMHPLVYGESLHAPGKPTILFYGHYDVQPAEPLDLWTSPAFEPTIRGGNLYGRGTADDKGQVHIHIRALDAIMKTAGKLPINLKVMIEGEEEVGSVSLWEFVNANKARLKADALVVSDTGMLARGVPSITYGLRGLNYYQIEITGPAQDLHSGIFGGAVPNPITILCELFAKLHDKNSRVAVPGFYDDVAKLSKAERKALNSLPWKASEFRKTVGAPGLSGEKGFSIVEQLWTRPTLELNGIWGGYTGEGAKTVIPSKAYAKFSTRLVPNQNPDKITRLVERHIRKLLPKTVKFKLDVLSQGKAVGRALHASVLRGRARRAGEGIRQARRVHPRGRIDSVRHADA